MSAREWTTSLRAASGLRPRVLTWETGVWAAMGCWVAVLSAMAWAEYVDFQHAKYDLGNMTQAVWSTAHGRFLEVTLVTGEQGSRLGLHVDPILALLAPLWHVAPTPLMLVAVQILVISTGALPVFWLAERHLDSRRAAGLLAIAYLACPWVAWITLEVFHPVSLAIPLLLFGVWFLDVDRLGAFAICAVLTLMTGELMGATVAALGIWYALARKRRAGYVIAAGGLAWSVIAIYVVVPAFAGGSSPFYGYYESVGGSPAGVIRTALTDPGTILGALTTQNDLVNLFALALPFVGLFFLSPGVLAVATPQLLANGLSDSPAATSPVHHYASAILPFLFVATVFGLKRFTVARREFLAMSMLITCLALSIVFGTFPGSPGDMRASYVDVPTEKVDALRDAVSLIPDSDYVSATNRVAVRFSAREFIHTVPVIGRADWIVVDRDDIWIPWIVAGRDQPDLLRTFIRRVEADPGWVKAFEREGVLVFRRAGVSETSG